MTNAERATDWEFVDHQRKSVMPTMPVMVMNHVRINGEKAPIHFHRGMDVYVHAGSGRELLVSIVVHPDDVTWTEPEHGPAYVDTIGGIPVLTPIDEEYASHPIVTEAEPVRPNGSHYPRALGDDGAETSTDWVRVWVQARSANFRFAREAD